MELAPLATLDDLAARGLIVDTPETAIANQALDSATAIVRDAAGCPISQTTSTIVLEGQPQTRLHLPGQPVTDVASVTIDGTPVMDWRLRSGALWRELGWSHRHGWTGQWEPPEVEITYTHGLPTVPADIIDMVCRLAATVIVAYRNNPDGEALAERPAIQERIGDYSATYAYAAQFSEAELPAYLRDRLAARFGGGAYTVRYR